MTYTIVLCFLFTVAVQLKYMQLYIQYIEPCVVLFTKCYFFVISKIRCTRNTEVIFEPVSPTKVRRNYL